MKGYKGFNKGMVCRGKKYVENTTFEEDKAEICHSGMHFCENPLEVFSYYPPVDDDCNLNEYAEVEANDVQTDDRGKYCAKKLRVGAKVSIAGLVQAFVDFTLGRVKRQKSDAGNCSAATNTGNRSAATNTGNRSAATNTGDRSVATNTGDRSAATNTGNWSAATNTGDCSAATNTGNRSAATNTGGWSAATNTGNWSAATNTGDCSAASVEGQESIAVNAGVKGKAKGALGCYIALAEWDKNENYEWHIKAFKSHKVDGKTIKPDTFYQLINGKFKEVK